MRNTRLFLIAFFLLTSFLVSGSAFADDSMTFVGPAGNNSGGVYTYPYDFTINGGSITPLICDTFDNEVTPGETWKATESSIPSATGLFSSNPTGYEAAGLIFDSILGVNNSPVNINGNTNDANWAIWALFSTTALNDIEPNNASSPFGINGDPNAYNIYLAALGDVSTAPAGDFTGIVVYTPELGSQSGTLGTPQEYLGYTPMPEPGESSLIGILALAGVGAFTFRKRLAPKLAISIGQ